MRCSWDCLIQLPSAKLAAVGNDTKPDNELEDEDEEEEERRRLGTKKKGNNNNKKKT